MKAVKLTLLATRSYRYKKPHESLQMAVRWPAENRSRVVTLHKPLAILNRLEQSFWNQQNFLNNYFTITILLEGKAKLYTFLNIYV